MTIKERFYYVLNLTIERREKLINRFRYYETHNMWPTDYEEYMMKEYNRIIEKYNNKIKELEEVVI